MCYFNLFISQNSNYAVLEPEWEGPVILNEADPLVLGIALLVSTCRVCVPVTDEVLAQLRRTVSTNLTGPSM